jgi:cyclase
MTTSKQLMLTISLFLLMMVSLFGQDFDQVEIKAEKISDNIYMLTGQGGNIGLMAGADGAVMIDDQYAPLTEKISAAIAGITDQPVRFLINTHWHGDHVGGNENFGKKGALIVAHENVRKRMSTEQFMEAFDRTVPPSPVGALPVITFAEDIAFHLNGEDILVMHLHNAHTDGDAIIYFATSNVLHTGDIYFAGSYPFIDLSSGGSIDGIIDAVNKVLLLIDEETKIIPGHGPASNKEALKTYRDTLQTIRDRVKKAIDAGKTIEEIKAAGLTKDFDDPWGTGFVNGETIVNILYSDLSK